MQAITHKPSFKLVACLIIFTVIFFNVPVPDLILAITPTGDSQRRSTVAVMEPTPCADPDNCSGGETGGGGGGGTGTLNKIIPICNNLSEIQAVVAQIQGAVLTYKPGDLLASLFIPSQVTTAAQQQIIQSVQSVVNTGCGELGPMIDNIRVHNAGNPSDPLFDCDHSVESCGGQWNLDKIQAPDAWDIADGNQNVTLAVLDSGISTTHEDLRADTITANWLATAADFGHGTWSAGVMAATTSTSGGIGIAGVIPNPQTGNRNISLFNTKVNDPDNPSTALMTTILNGATWALSRLNTNPDDDARIVYIGYDMSSGSTSDVEARLRWLDCAATPLAYRTNCSGLPLPLPPFLNTSNAVIVIPASKDPGIAGSLQTFTSYSRVIVVGGTTRDDLKSYDSHFGPWIDLGAPSGGSANMAGGSDETYNLLTLAWNNNSGYPRVYGTSFAAAEVAAVIGLILDANPNYLTGNNMTHIKPLLTNLSSVDQYPASVTGLGAGRLNVCKAVERAAIAGGANPSLCPLKVYATSTPTIGTAPLSVAFACSVVNNADPSLSYAWNFDDGSADSNAQNPNHTYENTTSGDVFRNATCTVTDAEGRMGSDSVLITVHHYIQCNTDGDCSNGDLCDGIETCVDNLCQAGTPLTCDDGLFCNGQETCDAGSGCVPGTNPCGDDGLFCNGTESCNESNNQCETSGDPCPPGQSCDEDQDQCISNNEPPQVDAGLDQTIQLPNIVTLDGTVTDDGLPEPPEIFAMWEKISGPQGGIVTFSDAYSTDTTASFSIDGAYVLRLYASDGELEASDNVQIIVQPECVSNSDCGDGNTCTEDICTLKSICHDGQPNCTPTPSRCENRPRPTGFSCSDGAFCNGAETCNASQVCQPGTPPNCSGFNDQCNVGVCDENMDQCVANPVMNGTVCDDGNVCSLMDRCMDGICQSDMMQPGCIPCQTDTDCNDNNVCDGAESCQAGQCTAGTPISCGDNDVCNGIESCDPVSGCQAGTPLTCNDGNVCNGTESCNPSTGCEAGTPLACDDGNVCNGAESCDTALGCQAGTPLNCDNGLFCDGQETCNPALGCQAGTTPNCSVNNLDPISTCTNDPDNNSSTFDSFAGFTSTCDENQDQCTTGTINLTHTCSIAQCGAQCEINANCTPTDCDNLDGCVGPDYHDYADVSNACLTDCSCTQNTCGAPTVIPNDPRCGDCAVDNDCNSLDRDYCSGDNILHDEGRCVSFHCQADTTTTQDCNNLNNSYCDGTAVKSDDYTCNTAQCVVDTTSTLEECNDGIFCNGTETCANSACAPGTPPACNDQNICTNDTCDENNDQCVFDLIPGCEACTDPSQCDDGNPCTDDMCIVALAGAGGMCSHSPMEDGISCESDNNVCNGINTCQAGQCTAGTPISCGDNDVCNGIESCDPVSGCQAGTPLTCNDGNVCNGTESCNPSTGCEAGTPLACDDGNVCNGAESCDTALGCQAGTPLVCDDGNICNGTETCNTGTGCQTGTPLICNDGLFCNGTESCNPTLGCQAGSIPCPADGLFCNGNEICDEALDQCQNTGNPCPPGETCDEPTDQCIGANNQPPQVNAGPDASIPASQTLNLHGTATDDGMPNPPGALTTTWSPVSGPGTVTFGNDNAAQTTATFSAIGTYVLRLTANDSALQASDDVTIRVVPNVSFSPGQSYHRKGFTMTYRDAVGNPYPMGTQYNDACVMFRAIGKWMNDGSYEPIDCGADGNYSDCEDLMSTGPVHIEAAQPGGTGILTQPKWITSNNIKAYVPNVDFSKVGCSNPQDAFDVQAYNFAVTNDCSASRNGPIAELGTYRVDRDPMQTLNGFYAGEISIDKLYMGEYPTTQNGGAGEPLYPNNPNADPHTQPFTITGPAYSAYVTTTPSVNHLLDYAAYRRGWTQCLGAGCGYGVGYGSGEYYGAFSPQGAPAVMEILTGSGHWLGPTPVNFENPHQCGANFPVTRFNTGCAPVKCDTGWSYETPGGCYPAIIQDGFACAVANNNPYAEGRTTLAIQQPVQGPEQLSQAERVQLMDDWEGENVNVYQDVWIMHDILGYSTFKSHHENCTNYDQIRLRNAYYANEPLYNTSLCNAALPCMTAPNPPPCQVLDTDSGINGCNPGSGTWIYKPIDNGPACNNDSECAAGNLCVLGFCRKTCGDGVTCTSRDVCSNGQCRGESNCDDGDSLTADSCNPDTGQCNYTNHCAAQETECRVSTGQCGADGQCVFTNLPDGTTCDDQNACTSSSSCQAGACVSPIPPDQVCNDGFTCTNDVCDPLIGCIQVPDNSQCGVSGNQCLAHICDPYYSNPNGFESPNPVTGCVEGERPPTVPMPNAECTNPGSFPNQGNMCDPGESCNTSCTCESLCGNGVWDQQAGELCDWSVAAGSPGHYYNPSPDDIRICQNDCTPCDSCGDHMVTEILGEECDTDPSSDTMDICGDPTSVGPSTRGECRYQCVNGSHDGILQGTPQEVPCNPITHLCPDQITECHPEYAPCPVPQGEMCDPLTSDGSTEAVCGSSTPGVETRGCSLYDVCPPNGQGGNCHYESSCQCVSQKILPQGPEPEDRACEMGIEPDGAPRWLSPRDTDDCKFGCIQKYTPLGCRESTPENPCTCYGIDDWENYEPDLVLFEGAFYKPVGTSACLASGEPMPQA